MRSSWVALVGCAMLFGASSGATQTRSVARFDPLDAFVGTWVATNANEQTPYMILRVEERGGKLAGSMNRFRFAIGGKGMPVGREPAAGEVSLPDLKLYGGDIGFTWRVNPPFEGLQTQFVAEGTELAMLVFLVPGPAISRIMAENPGANAFNPVISLRRVSRNPLHQPTPGDVTSVPPWIPGDWQPPFMAQLINTAEVQYKMKHGVYGDYLTLLRSGQLEYTGNHDFTLTPGNLRRGRALAESDPLPGYSFRLALSADKKAYRLSMRPKAMTTCRDDVMTDETGIVTAGCSATSASHRP